MTGRACTSCGSVLPPEAFYRQKHGDGLMPRCKRCVCAVAQRRRDSNRDEYNAGRRAYWRSKGYRRKANEIRTTRPIDPVKVAARIAVNNAVQSGRLVKPSACEGCGASGKRLHGHHADYSKPLDVAWLCQPCHARRHWKEAA